MHSFKLFASLFLVLCVVSLVVCQKPADACNPLIDHGTGTLALTRWGWNARDCVEFIYRGQGGNTNNFPSKELCEQVCKP
ncbi:hypothetical protein niasHT_021644 [Heterodera trifolii]|uniref:BPTI/Kunitz inhibitor domain-containing protein n=1 Tax=Heterodera trifolii TaxID=157864 RepID=A0ABD2JT44_9BILA